MIHSQNICDLVFNNFFCKPAKKKARLHQNNALQFVCSVDDLSEFLGEEWWIIDDYVNGTRILNGQFKITSDVDKNCTRQAWNDCNYVYRKLFQSKGVLQY